MRIYEASIITDEIFEAFKKLIFQLDPNCPVPAKTELEEIINAPNTVVFLAGEDTILGTLTLVIIKTPSGKKAVIEDVVVDKTARGKAIGERLIHFAINYASVKGISKIDLTSLPERIAANNLYKKMGFLMRDTNVYRLIIDE